MAKLVCTVRYSKSAKKLIRTYHIEFEKSDKLEINTTTEDLALRVEKGNPAAKRLIKRWKTERPKNSVPAGEPSDVYIAGPPKPPLVGVTLVSTKRFTASVSMKAEDVAKFQCGYYEAESEHGKKKGFTRYPNAS